MLMNLHTKRALALFLVFGLTACSKSDSDNSDPSPVGTNAESRNGSQDSTASDANDQTDGQDEAASDDSVTQDQGPELYLVSQSIEYPNNDVCLVTVPAGYEYTYPDQSATIRITAEVRAVEQDDEYRTLWVKSESGDYVWINGRSEWASTCDNLGQEFITNDASHVFIDSVTAYSLSSPTLSKCLFQSGTIFGLDILRAPFEVEPTREGFVVLTGEDVSFACGEDYVQIPNIEVIQQAKKIYPTNL